MTKFEQAIINAEIEKQTKTAERNAKKKYIADLMAEGIDKQLAKIMADVDFEYGLVKAL